MCNGARAHERWIWTELIGFDNTSSDYGVAEYIDRAGFVPDAVCLLITSPDFVLSYDGIGEERQLPPDYCARDGHEFNRERARQDWTDHQLRSLIQTLQAHGTEVYLTVFTRFYNNEFHHEWISDHREVCQVHSHVGWFASLNILARLDDGTYLEDFFLSQLVRVCVDYGFNGWHGADGWGPNSGSIFNVSVGDDIVAQFAEHCKAAPPADKVAACGNDVEKLGDRAKWIWSNRRHEWIQFYSDRWTRYWEKAVSSLHAAGKKAVINSSWGRAPFESLYRYGVDYRRIVDTGVDGIIVEAVAAALAMDPRAFGDTVHYDFLSMLLLIRAYVPDAKLIFLHNVHDVVEQWDAIHHGPAILEKEIYSLANIFHTKSDGSLQPCADGFLVCLGDAIGGREWEWLREKWALGFGPIPVATGGVTLVWSDDVMHRQIHDFTETRTWFTHRLLFHLMTHGAPVQTTVRIEDLAGATGPLLVLNPHLYSADDIENLRAYSRGPVVFIGPDLNCCGGADSYYEDAYPDANLKCAISGHSLPVVPAIVADEPEEMPHDLMALEDRMGYWDHFICRPVSPVFLRTCAQILVAISDFPAVTNGAQVTKAGEITEDSSALTAMSMTLPDGRQRIAVKNKRTYYVMATIDIGQQVKCADVVTHFPAIAIRPEGTKITLRVPDRGVVVLDVTT